MLNVFVDRTRWRRDWLVSQVDRRLEYHAASLEALYAQHVLLDKAAHGTAIAVPERDAAIASWRTQLARSLTFAPAAVQHTVRRYDEAQAGAATAINGGKATPATLEALDEARLAVLDAIQQDRHDMTPRCRSTCCSPWRRLLLRGRQPVGGGTGHVVLTRRCPPGDDGGRPRWASSDGRSGGGRFAAAQNGRRAGAGPPQLDPAPGAQGAAIIVRLWRRPAASRSAQPVGARRTGGRGCRC